MPVRDFGKATWGKYGGEPVHAFVVHGADFGGTELGAVEQGRRARGGGFPSAERYLAGSQTISEVCQRTGGGWRSPA